MSGTMLWERRAEETHKAFEAFVMYRDLGAQRSSATVAARLGKSTTLIERWCRRHSWEARAAAYDAMVDSRVLHVRHREMEKSEARWVERRAKQREREWDVADKLMERAEQMLALPLMRQKIVQEDGQMVTYVEPAGWKHADIVRFLQTAVEIARLSAGMNTTQEDLRTAVLQNVRTMARKHGLDPAEAVERAERMLNEQVYLPEEAEHGQTASVE